MSRFTILAGGGLVPTRRLESQVAGTRAIAADSGIVHASALRLDVELWVGDFDSSGPDLVARHSRIERRVFPAAKARSDTELAVDAALERGATSLVIAGGFGGQADHALSHLALAVALAQRGMSVLVTSGSEEAYPLLPGPCLVDLPANTRMSVLPFSDLKAISLKNVAWPLERRDVQFGSTLTLANVALGPVSIALDAGYGVVIAYPSAT